MDILKLVLSTMFLFPSFSFAKLTSDSKAEKYYIYSYSDKDVFVKKGKHKYKIKRENFRMKNIKVNQWVSIHPEGMKKYGQLTK